MSSISVIVPHWNLRPEHDGMLHQMVKSLPDGLEIIIIVNDGIGMGKAINMGMILAHGDYLIVSNNDLTLVSGRLDDLCIPGTICAPYLQNKGGSPRQAPCGSFYCMPRSIYEQIGGYDEQFEVGYYEDEDYQRRWEEAGYKVVDVPSVVIEHDGGATLNTLPNRDEIVAANKAKYEAKWGD